MSDLPVKKMPNESKLLNLFVKLEKTMGQLQTRIDETLLKDRSRALIFDDQDELRQFYKTWKNEMLILEIEKISSDSKDIQATKKKQIKILENDLKRAEAQYFKLDLKMQHQKEKLACDVPWKSKMTKLIDENVNTVQHQQEVNDLVEDYNQKTYVDVRAKNQDLLIIISELKEKLAKQAKNMNTKFDKSATLEKPVCVTPLNKNKDLKAKKISKVEIKTERSKPVTSCSIAKSGQTQKTNVLNAKTVNAVLDGLNLVCVSCGKDVFQMSHDKCVTRYALSSNSRVKRVLFTSPVAAKFSKLSTTPVVVKSSFIVATPPKSTNKVSRASPLTPKSKKSNT
ncbi:hypothetical protein Tco_0512591 [Tanacetum coccineum]